MTLKNTRAGNYPEWYQNVVAEADMAFFKKKLNMWTVLPKRWLWLRILASL